MSVASLTLLVLVAAAVRPSPDAPSLAVSSGVTEPPSAAAKTFESAAPAPSASPSPEVTASPSPTPEPSPEQPSPEASPAPTQAQKDKPKKDKPKTIDTPRRSLYLAVGHGHAPNGKLQVGSINPRTGHKEIDAAAIIVEAMVDVLRRAPNIRLWAESGRDHPNLVGTVARANRRGAQDCIEVHQDWYKAPRGAFAHWFPGARDSQTLANRLVRGLREEGVEFRPRWHKPRSELYFLRETKCRAVLVEVGRVGDFSKKELREYGRALAVAYIKDIRK